MTDRDRRRPGLPLCRPSGRRSDRRGGGERRASAAAVDEAFLAPLLAGARTTLGPTAFDAAERAGAALKREALLDSRGARLADLGDDL